jgi:dipeptidase D
MIKTVVDNLEPSMLWKRFYEISLVPRPSKGEEQIRAYLRSFASARNLRMKEDKVGNIVICVEPTAGYEKSPVVVLQSHVDMVCEKNKGKEHNFDVDPLKLIRSGEWIKADGTTLGADNGIGVAAALAVASDYSVTHGPLELLFTVDEETGLTGVNSLEPGYIKGKYLLNLDTEEDGIFYVGCAGGVDTVGTFNIEWKKLNKNYIPFLLSVGGLKGGHSGINISDKRASAIKLLGYLLNELSEITFEVGYMSGGSKRNAIAREAEALLYINPEEEAKIRELINEFSLSAILEYQKTDSDIKISFEPQEIENNPKVFENKFYKRILNAILGLPHGPISMSADIEGLVETSTNLATLTIDEDKFIIGTCQRSSIESAKRNIAASVKSVFELAGGEVVFSDGYPGWQPNLDSKLLKIAKKSFTDTFDKIPEMKAVHAGLECGILSDKFPDLEMISFGPTIEGAHSPDERVSIPTVEKFYNLLQSILTDIASLKNEKNR